MSCNVIVTFCPVLEEQERRWGKQYKAYHRKIVQAVAETAGEVLRYDGALIEPLYHASCGGGRTEDAAEVWGNARPYLVSVECNHPADPHTGQKVTMTLETSKQSNYFIFVCLFILIYLLFLRQLCPRIIPRQNHVIILLIRIPDKK